jgi:hypothetical protein
MPLPAEWGIMTDRERAAWKAKNEPAPAPSGPASGSVEAEIDEIYARKGGYLKSPRGDTGHTDHK